jgi:hypothetical protein
MRAVLLRFGRSPRRFRKYKNRFHLSGGYVAGGYIGPIRFLIALHSPYALLETGLRMCPPGEKAGRCPLRRRAARSLKSRLPVSNRKIRALFAYFGGRRPNFLCSADCLAEEERFELWVRFCRAKARRVRKLQIAKPCQRISPETRHQNWAISPVSIRHLFVRERRMQGDCVAKMVTS